MQIHRVAGIAGATTVHGATVVIDVFRAFSAAAYALAAGAPGIVLAAEVDEATAIASRFPDAVLMGEDRGIKPGNFDLGNSPGEISARPEAVRDKTVVHRSSAGTRCARAALDSGASPLYVASLVVASATASALKDESSITLVASGQLGTSPAAEDDACADLVTQLLHGDRRGLATVGTRVAALDRARYLTESSFAHPEDVRLCCDVDRFDFAMIAERTDGLVQVRRSY